PALRQVKPDGELIPPRRHAMRHAGFGEHVHHRLDRRKNRAVDELFVVAVVILLALHRVLLGRQLLRRNIPKRAHTRHPPFHKPLVHWGKRKSRGAPPQGDARKHHSLTSYSASM